jgi:hypothetical protein
MTKEKLNRTKLRCNIGRLVISTTAKRCYGGYHQGFGRAGQRTTSSKE